MITYKPIDKSTGIHVLLDGKVVGVIRNEYQLGYRYIPRAGVHSGDYFPTLEACKRSLEDDDDAPSTTTGREG